MCWSKKKKKKKSPGFIVEQYSKSSKEIFFIVLVSIIPRRHHIKLSFDLVSRQISAYFCSTWKPLQSQKSPSSELGFCLCNFPTTYYVRMMVMQHPALVLLWKREMRLLFHFRQVFVLSFIYSLLSRFEWHCAVFFFLFPLLIKSSTAHMMEKSTELALGLLICPFS